MNGWGFIFLKNLKKAQYSEEMSVFRLLFWVGWKDEHFFDFLGRMNTINVDELQKYYLESKLVSDERMSYFKVRILVFNMKDGKSEESGWEDESRTHPDREHC